MYKTVQLRQDMAIAINVTQTINELLRSRYTNEVSDSIQRLTSGLKINDSADDIGGLISSNNLASASSALRQGIENGNSGIALVQVSNKALSNQLDILNTIKDKLNFAKYDSVNAASKDIVRLDIIDLIEKFDTIASDTNYNNIYTLQKSDSDNDFSLPTTITLESSNVTTQSIQSNSDGLSLGTLKNLTSGGLTSDISVAQLDIIDDAIDSINNYTNSFNLSKTEFEIAVENITGIEKTTTLAKDNLLKTNELDENAILDKYRLLEKSSEFAIVQANLTQATVLKLLATPIEVVDYSKKDNTFTHEDKTKPDYSNTNNSSYNNDSHHTDFFASSNNSDNTSSANTFSVDTNNSTDT